MVWTEIPLDGRTDLYVFARCHMTTAIHRNDIRELLVRPYAGAIVDIFILMQDNACAHTDRMSLTFLYEEDISVMNWQTSTQYDLPGAFFLDVFDNGRVIQGM